VALVSRLDCRNDLQGGHTVIILHRFCVPTVFSIFKNENGVRKDDIMAPLVKQPAARDEGWVHPERCSRIDCAPTRGSGLLTCPLKRGYGLEQKHGSNWDARKC
jgi:hypothetical protein